MCRQWFRCRGCSSIGSSFGQVGELDVTEFGQYVHGTVSVVVVVLVVVVVVVLVVVCACECAWGACVVVVV